MRDMGNLHVNGGLFRPFCSRIRAGTGQTDRQRDRQDVIHDAGF